MALPERGPQGNPELNLPERILSVEDFTPIEPEVISPKEKSPAVELPIIDSSVTAGKQRSRPVEIFSSARQSFKPREYWHHIEERARPGALTTVGTLDAAMGFAFLPVAEPSVAAIINTGVNMAPTLTIPTVATAIGALTAVSIKQEIDALRKERFSATTVGTIAFTITGEPRISSAINHGGNYLFVTLILNPVTALALLTNNPQLLIESFATTPLVLTPWYILVNSFIARGQVEKIVNPINKAKETTWGRIKHAIKR